MAVERRYIDAPVWHRFVSGGTGDMTAALVSHPLDVIKVRCQIHKELVSADHAKLGKTVKQIFMDEGIRGFYRGLSASLFRQLLYSSNRHGIYALILHDIAVTQKSVKISMYKRMMAGMCGGIIGALLANPADVVLVRMQADGSLPQNSQRRYSHVFNGIFRCY